MVSLTAHQVAAWLSDHTIVHEMHITTLLQQEAEGARPPNQGGPAQHDG